MKAIGFIFLLVSCSLFGQSWKDTVFQAKNAYKSAQYDVAYDKFLSAQRLAPEDVDLSSDIGTAAYRSGDFEMAEKAFQRRIDNSADNISLSKKWHNVGNTQFKQQNYQAAIASYKNALRQNPKNEEARYNLSQAQRLLQNQEQQKDNENQDDSSENDQQDNQNENNQSQNQNQNKDNQDQENNEDQAKQNQDQQDGQQDNSTQDESTAKSISDKRIERMLDELLKQEMETKKKVRGKNSKGQEEKVKSGKKW